MLSNEAAIEVRILGIIDSEWLDLPDFSNQEELNEHLHGETYTILSFQGIPHQFYTSSKSLYPEAFEFGQLDEHTREIVYLYSQEAGSSTHRSDLIKEAQAKFWGTWQSETDFAKHVWDNQQILDGVSNQIIDCIDWDKVVKKLKDEDRYTFMDCEEGYAVFCP